MIKQLKIKLNNKPGTLKKCVTLLAEQGVDIKALELTERGAGEFGKVHMIVSDLNKAASTLQSNGIEHDIEEVLAAEMDDRVGGLAQVLGVLLEKDINIKYLYAFISRMEGKSLAVFSVDKLQEAKEALEKANVPMISQKALEAGVQDSKFNITVEDHFGKDFIW